MEKQCAAHMIKRKSAIHMVSAFSTANSLVLGQVKTKDHSNEITAIPELLNMLDIKEKIDNYRCNGMPKGYSRKDL